MSSLESCHRTWTSNSKSPSLPVTSIPYHEISSDVGLWTKSFGANISYNITKRTTHLVAAPNRKTVKVKKAARHPKIKIVTTGWLMEAFTTWKRPDETPYLIPVDGDDAGHGLGGDTSPLDELEDGDFLSAEDDEAGATEEPTPDDSDFENPDFNNNEWAAMHDDLDDFLNETDDEEPGRESDTDSVRSGNETDLQGDPNPSTNGRKRRREDGSTEPSDTEDSDASTTSRSKLQKRKKRAFERVTSLTNMTVAVDPSGLPSPDTTGPEEHTNGKAAPPAADEDDDDDLEAEMMAGFDDDEYDDDG